MRYHTGRPGGLKTKYFKEYVIKKPEFIFYYGVYKQLPKNQLRFKYMDKLFVYKGPEVEYADFLPNVKLLVYTSSRNRKEKVIQSRFNSR